VKIYNDLEHFRALKPVVTLGTFDGVHLGHRKVLERLKEIAAQTGGETVIFTFHPHPRQVLYPGEHNLRLLNTLAEKTELLEQAGVDHLVVFPFTRAFAELSYRQFVHDILVDRLNTSCLVVGYDHKFGKDRQGDFHYLQACAEKYHFRVERLDVLLSNELEISSTRIREALESGDIQKANRFLGYPYSLHGRVVEGRKVGRLIGFPTANIEADEVTKLIPGYGVYAVWANLSGTVRPGMLNIGIRPTFAQNADERSIEVHLFDFDELIYGCNITLYFQEKLRDELKFPDKEALIRQLHLDRQAARNILDSL